MYREPQIPNFGAIAQTVRTEATRAAESVVHDFAESERIKFQTRIRRQEFESFDAFPLTPRWYQKKKAAGADLRVMIATRHYLEEIKVITERNSNVSVTVYVGFDEMDRTRDLEGNIVPYPLYKIARVHEHGSVKMHVPARSHWRPFYEEMHERSGEVRERIRRVVALALRKKYGKIIKR